MRKFLSFLVVALFAINIANAQFSVILVDDDNNTAEADPIVTALTNWGGTYSVFTTGVADQDTLPPTYADIQDYDMVIWYTGNDGITTLWDVSDTTGVGPGAIKFTDALSQFVANGGVVWIDGLDFIYDIYGGAADDFALGDFVYDKLGIAKYLSQSKADDGGLGVSEMVKASTNTITTLDPMAFAWSTMWYADGYELTDDATALYEMGGDDTYPLLGQVTGLYKDNIIATSFRIAKLDNQENTDLLVSEMITAAENGTFQATSVKNVEHNTLSLYPNPVVENTTINLSKVKGANELNIFDITGRKVYTQALNAGQEKVIINVDNLTSGLYNININADNAIYTTKMTVVK